MPKPKAKRANEIERRNYAITDVRSEETKNDDGLTTRKVTGYAAVFDSPSDPIGGMFVEYINRGAFSKTLKEGDPVALWNHNTDIPLARRSAGSLFLEEDEKGLRFDLTLPETTAGKDAHILITDNIVREMSFGFSVIKDEWSKSDDGGDVRHIGEVRLGEISPVTFPAYPATEVEARAIMEKRCVDCTDLTEDTTEPLTNATHSGAVDEELKRATEDEKQKQEQEQVAIAHDARARKLKLNSKEL